MGSKRKQALGRLVAGIYLGTLGAFIVIPVVGILAGIFWIIDWLKSLLLDEPLMSGQVYLASPLVWHYELSKFFLFGEEFPGYNPIDSEYGAEPTS